MATDPIELLEKRKAQVHDGKGAFEMACEKASVAGSVSQRACSFCGSRVVLYPIADALHLVHGPIGCAAYTWDIRGALSSGPNLHRLSFSTDMQEKDVVYGGEKKLHQAICELTRQYSPKAVFVYATCIAGVIGDDVKAVCKKAEAELGVPVIPVDSEGFKGSKKAGYHAACDALMDHLVGTGDVSDVPPVSINILGDFNLAGEIWMIEDYYKKMGVDVVCRITGDGRVEDIRKMHGAALNVVQCSGSVTRLAEMIKQKYGIPYIRVSYFGIEDMSKSLYDVADFFKDDPSIMARAKALVASEVKRIMPELMRMRKDLEGKKAAIYTGGAFKVFSLVRSLRTIGMKSVVAGSQTGTTEDYKQLHELCDEGAVLLDDTNPVELAKFILEKDVDLFIGGVKERPIAFKLGVAFCDHNHERKIALAGFEGLVNFAKEVHASVMSPVWKFVPRRAHPAPKKHTAKASLPKGCTPAMCMTCDSDCGGLSL
ncbi:MAG: nitrogenase iron-molybdenum cofactor biosynthesis protein NifE [Kiritimatiellales bacterium]